jgi:DNA-binding NtrC family response regulator
MYFMSKPIHVLILEDNAAAAEINIRELRRAGFDPRWKRVETEADFLAELDKSPDLILADYSLPHFDGLRAVKLLRARGQDIPFILISGTIGEEAAVEVMKHGATDFMFKDRIVRLGSAVEHALAEKQLRDERKEAEKALREQTEELRAQNEMLSRFNRVAVDRELRMIELKREVNELCEKLGEPSRHKIVKIESALAISTETQT